MGNEASQPGQGGSNTKYAPRLENDVKVTWKRCTKDSAFAPRDGHCAAAINKKLYVFGGVMQAPDGECCESNELLQYDPESKIWTKVNCKGKIPHPRCSATMVAIGDKLYLFGGLSQETGWTDQLHVFDTVSEEWSEVVAEGNSPSPRDKVASAVVNNKMYVFGGFGPQGTEDSDDEEEDEDGNGVPQDQEAAQFGWFNDLHLYDPESNSWSEPMQMNTFKPSPRAAMGMCAVHKHLVIFGGRDMVGRCNDYHVFNTETRRWETEWLKETAGCQPEPRSFHTCTTVGNRVVVFGGRGTQEQHFNTVHIYDTATKQWLQPQEEGDCPQGRGLHTATLVVDQLLVFGGSSDFQPEINQCMKYYNDVHSLSAGEVLAVVAKGTASKGTWASGSNDEPPAKKSKPAQNTNAPS